MVGIEVPVRIVVDAEVSFGVFDDAVGVVEARANAQVDRASAVRLIEIVQSVVDGLRELHDIA